MLLFLYFINFNYVMSETTDQRCPEKKKKKGNVMETSENQKHFNGKLLW